MMDTNEIGAFGYAVALIVYALLTILLLSGWRRSDQSRLPALATGISLVWAGVWTAGFLDLTRAHALVTTVEWARGLSWLVASLAILREIADMQLTRRLLSAYGVFVLLLAGLPVGYFLFSTQEPESTLVWVSGGFVFSLLSVLAAEQLYRNASIDSRPGVTYLCIAIAGVFLFDLLMYGRIMAGVPTGPEYWAARGFVNAMLAAPLVLGTWRRSHLSPEVQVPRQIAFYSFGITVIAVYIVLVIIGHHYVQRYGGTWSTVGSIVLIVAAIVMAVLVFASGRIRARVRVFLMKTFLQYKYDYRKEWLRFISTLSKSGLEDVRATAVRAVAEIVNSPGGIVWIQEQESKAYLAAGSWRCTVPNVAPITESSGLVRFLRDRQWIIDLEEMDRYPDRYEDLRIDSWLQNDDNWWLVVPLFLGKRLYGFIVLLKPRVVPSLNFEDHDLLRTVGRHVGMHINQAETDKRLAESRQFGAYNRLTAFLMHDLNNLIAQQSLVVKNAEKFRDNPDFVDDTIETIAHSVDRMNRLMEQLTSASKAPMTRHADLRGALTEAVERCGSRTPVPSLDSGDTPMMLAADPERLTTVFEHIIRNAQDASDEDGRISVTATIRDNTALVAIQDYGQGMEPEFIRERLFRPFDSTKGSHSMGIGAYQARDYVRTLGGRMEVSSELGVGTEFSIRLPLSD
ncbi:MAG: PEP-CTERM system histidine kinase PrsK [Gammaproteobacteria bacterium]|nr:PEP-CTERM system histidine kinase PrsK [Gammaproteobacteria bacterium]